MVSLRCNRVWRTRHRPWKSPEINQELVHAMVSMEELSCRHCFCSSKIKLTLILRWKNWILPTPTKNTVIPPQVLASSITWNIILHKNFNDFMSSKYSAFWSQTAQQNSLLSFPPDCKFVSQILECVQFREGSLLSAQEKQGICLCSWCVKSYVAEWSADI